MALDVVLATRAGVEYGRVHGAEGISVSRGVKAPRTAQFTLPEGHAFRGAARLAPRTIAKVYDVDDANTRTLKHVGPITSYHRAAGENVVTNLGSADPAWYLDRRAITVLNRGQVAHKRGDLLKWTVRALQGEPIADAAYLAVDAMGASLFQLDPYSYGFLTPGPPPGAGIYGPPRLDTGIRVRTIADTPTVLIESGPPTKASNLFSLATAGLDGPDWAVYPSEPAADTYGVRLGHLDVAPTIGQARPDVVFEYGAGKRNVSGFEEVIDPSTQANTVLANTPTGMAHQYDEAAFLEYGPLDDVIQTQIPHEPATIGAGGVTLGPGWMVNQLLLDHVAVRKAPRQIITFTVAPDVEPGTLSLEERRVPRPGFDYDFGDTVTFRATERVPVHDAEGTLTGFEPELTVDATFRVYNVTEGDDANGQRVTSLTVVAS